MMERQIKLSREDVLDFVNAASKCDCDIDISYNRVIIDAKSILGILSMDLNRVLTVKCHGRRWTVYAEHPKICSCIIE